jgi:phosphatidylinositol alpha-1,6-mannosyltransferase
MERLNLHMAQELSRHCELAVVGPAGCREYLPVGCRVDEVPAKPLPDFLLRSCLAAWKAGDRPWDMVIAGSGLAAVAVKLAARRAHARTAVYVHGLDLLAPSLVYQKIWVPTLRRFDQAIANSTNTAAIAHRLGVARGHVAVVHPGVNLPETENISATQEFRKKYQLKDRPVLLSVGRLTARKGLDLFIRCAFPLVKARYPDVILLVVGDEASDALTGSAAGSRATLQDLAVRLQMSDNVMFLRTLDDESLSSAYSAADVHVFPVRELPGDIEGFGMVAIEAAAHGLPTVAFSVGGIPDAVKHQRSGYLVEPGNHEQFAEYICAILEKRSQAGFLTSHRGACREFAQLFTWDKFGEKLFAQLQPLLEGKVSDS